MSSSCIRFVKRYLCVKKLTINDGFAAKSVKLPRAEARFFMGELRNRQATPLVLLDEGGSCWELLCTCTGGHYALSRIGAFCEAHGAQPGSYFIFYADHDHIVRLAVRQQLPEDVQAAVAAARAAMVLRNSPQRAPQQQQQGTTCGNATALLPTSQPPQPVLDDLVALDEMPRAVVPDCVRPGPTASTAVVIAPVATEPPRAKPLQDRSNLPVGAAISDASGKSKPMGTKQEYPAPMGAGVTAQSARATTDKENDVGAAARPPEKVQGPSPSSQVISSGGLSGTVPATNSSQQPHQPQQSGPRPSSPAAPSPPPARSPLPQPSPPPATRLRMRFEARLRAQAGKLHPLSVRTGPDSPLPIAPGYSSGFGFAWPAALAGPYSMQLAATIGASLLPFAWGAAGFQGDMVADCSLESSGADAVAGCSQEPNPYLAISNGTCAVGWMQGSNASLPQQFAESEDSAATPGPGTPHHDCWRRELQCEELLDWEVGRRSTCGSAAALDKPGIAAVPQQDVGHQIPRQPPPEWLLCESAAAQTVNLALLRHLLLQGQNHQALSIDEAADSAASASLTQQGVVPAGEHDAGRRAPLMPRPGRSQQDGLLLSLAATNSTLRQLLGMSPTAAAWDLAAMSRTTVTSGPAGEGSRGAVTASGVLHRMMRAPGQQPWDTNRSSPRYSAGQASIGSALPTATAPAAGVELSHPQQSMDGDTACDEDLPQHCGALPKSSLSCGRNAPGPPADSPRSKRHRSALASPRSNLLPACNGQTTCTPSAAALPVLQPPNGQSLRQPSPPSQLPLPITTPAGQLASKALTAFDLLTDRVTLSMATATCTQAVSLLQHGQALRGEEVSTDGSRSEGGIDAMDVDVHTHDGTGYGAAAVRQGSLPELGQQQQCRLKVAVGVVVESGAQYEGVLLVNVPGGSTVSCECELQGLRPYLIRRQAGVGDVLLMWMDENTQSGDTLRLRAQLQQRKAVA